MRIYRITSSRGITLIEEFRHAKGKWSPVRTVLPGIRPRDYHAVERELNLVYRQAWKDCMQEGLR